MYVYIYAFAHALFVGMTDAGMSIEGVWLDIASAVDLHKRLLALQVGVF